jgi:hypothetical protein
MTRLVNRAAEEMEPMMLSQITTVAAEAAAMCEMLLGAALLLAWMLFELIGYGGLLFYVARRCGWFTLVAPPAKPRRDFQWGITVRAEGLRFGNRVIG